MSVPSRSSVQRFAGASRVSAHGAATAIDYAYSSCSLPSSLDDTDLRTRPALTPLQQQRFHTLYREHFDFVFRNLRRLGVAPSSLDDALQDVFVVVLRRIPDLQHDAHVKAWLFAIVFRVAGNHRRSVRRRGVPDALGEHLASTQPGPFDLAARAQASQFLHRFLNSLDDNRRAVFVMAELEQLTVPEIAKALCANVNTVYSWLRAGRIAFTVAAHRMHSPGGRDHG